jgi:hypothetical protein
VGEGGVVLLLVVMSENSLDRGIISKCLGALANITEYDVGLEAVISEHGTSAVMGMLSAHYSSFPILQNALIVLEQLASADPNIVEELFKLGCVQLISDILKVLDQLVVHVQNGDPAGDLVDGFKADTDVARYINLSLSLHKVMAGSNEANALRASVCLPAIVSTIQSHLDKSVLLTKCLLTLQAHGCHCSPPACHCSPWMSP